MRVASGVDGRKGEKGEKGEGRKKRNGWKRVEEGKEIGV